MPQYRAQRLVEPNGNVSYTVVGPAGVVGPAERFLDFLDASGRSRNTCRGYASDLAHWWEFLGQRAVAWDRATLSVLAAFAAYLRVTNRSRPGPPANVVSLQDEGDRRAPASTQRALSAVTGLYDFFPDVPVAASLRLSRLQKAGVRKRGTRGRGPVGVHVPSRVPDSLTDGQLEVVVSAPAHLRDRLLLTLMGLNGLRVGAVLGLRHSDISLRRATLAVTPRAGNVNLAAAKRTQPLTVPLHPLVGRLYADYLDLEYGDLDSDYVFVNLWGGDYGRPMTYHAVRSLIDRTAGQVDVRFTAHTLRHTFATHLRRQGASLETVSALLGHASVDTTRQVYVHTTVEDLRRELERAGIVWEARTG